MLKVNHAEEYNSVRGFEARFSRCYTVMDDAERELHGLIRAYSEHSLFRINEEVATWLSQDRRFKVGAIVCSGSEELSRKLRDLEIHLILWRAKFEYWIPDQPHHAVVYMADEKKHGLGFPLGTDASVTRVAQELRTIWFGKRRLWANENQPTQSLEND